MASKPVLKQTSSQRRPARTVAARSKAALRGAAGTESPKKKKLAALTAERIQRDIAKAGWKVGQLLGNEAQLMERYSVSRGTLREAVRQLERHGVATMRRGFGGGLSVQEPAQRAAAQSIATFLELTHVSPRDLFEAKEVLELRAVNLAVHRLTDEHVRLLREGLRQIRALPFDVLEQEARLDGRIRRTLADAAGNPALAIFMEGLNRLTRKLLPERSSLAEMTGVHHRERELREQQVEAVIAGNATAAEQATLEELALARETTERSVRRFRRRTKDVTDLDHGSAPHVSPWDAQDKLPHRLAAAIAMDIFQGKLAVGSRVGSEPEFIERFDVSRAVFREAVRMLEGYGIVEMRRGYGGGLVVGLPDPTYIIALLTTYLKYAKLDRSHFLEIIGVVWVAAAPLAAERGDRAQARALFERAQAVDPNSANAAADTMRGQFGEMLGMTHNAAIVLIGETVLGLSEVYTLEPPPPDQLAGFKKLHCDVFGAVAAGDAGMARRTMSRYAAAMEAWFLPAEHDRLARTRVTVAL